MAYGPLALTPWSFGRLTPGEFQDLVEGYGWRREQEARDRIELAWMTAVLSRQRKIPSFERLVGQQGAKAIAKTAEERRAEYLALQERLG